MFALVDCNNFYASCQRVFDPKLQGRPIVILSNNDGCVIARSNEAKLLGIPMGAPAFTYQALFDQHDVCVFSSNFTLYGDMSSRVMNILSTCSPDIEIYSIDEAFLGFTGFEHFNLMEIGLNMRRKVIKSTSIPISIGFAPTKALAKVANKIAKSFPERTRAVYIIDSDEKRIKALKWTQIGDVWGIGRQHAKKLVALGILNAYQFTCLPDDWIHKHLSVVGLRLKKELQGIPTLTLEPPQNKKSIATTRSFDNMLTELIDLEERIATFAIMGAEKLRRQKSHCMMVSVFLLTNRFRKDLPQFYRNVVITAPYATNSTFEIVKLAKQGLKSLYQKGYAYKKAGVILMEITPSNQVQLQLFDTPDPRHEVIMDVVDNLNQIIGSQKIKFGGQALDRVWKMRQEKLSPKYTTLLSDIITIDNTP